MSDLISNNGAIGGPAITTILAFLHFVLAILCYCIYVHGLPIAAFVSLMAVVNLIILRNVFSMTTRFSPKRGDIGAEMWQWAEQTNARPTKIEQKFAKSSQRVLDLLRKRAQEAMFYEDQATKPASSIQAGLPGAVSGRL